MLGSTYFEYYPVFRAANVIYVLQTAHIKSWLGWRPSSPSQPAQDITARIDAKSGSIEENVKLKIGAQDNQISDDIPLNHSAIRHTIESCPWREVNTQR